MSNVQHNAGDDTDLRPSSPSPKTSGIRDYLGWRTVWLALYYLLILLGIMAMHASGSFATPTFIYQGF
jgi:hypothetical protein